MEICSVVFRLPSICRRRLTPIERAKKGIWGKIEGIDGEEIPLPDLMMWQQS